MQEKLNSIQKTIQTYGGDGWLLYDFRKTNTLACNILEISRECLLTRRFFYWIPKEGEPVKIVHRIESQVLAHLPGKICVYSSYEELNRCLKEILLNVSKVAMEYSPGNAIPTVSKVDAGTIEHIRSFGVKVESSADLLQNYTSVWTMQQYETHLQAAHVLQHAIEKSWEMIADSIRKGKIINEYDVQCFILHELAINGCVTDDPPICAVNVNSANPHYSVVSHEASIIRKGDFVLIDVWCKKNTPHAVYADITRICVVDTDTTLRQKQIFNVVKAGRDAAFDLIRERLSSGLPIYGWEVDSVCREMISKEGFGEYFTHRTGHNIGENDHGDGANIDNFETKEIRQLLPGTCFSIEPGVYLPGEFGVRLEDDVYLDTNGKNLHITPGLQEEIFCLFQK